MGTLLQPVDPIAPVSPAPSILTTARALPSAMVWKSGIQWRPTVKPGSVATAVDDVVSIADCPTPTDLTADFDPTDFGQALPVIARLPFECDEVLPGQAEQFRAEAQAALSAATAWFVSENVNTQLAAVDTSLNGAANVHPLTGLALLLASYFNCTFMGGPIVSVPPVLIPSLLGSGAVKQIGDQYVGPMGCLVNPGPHGTWGTANDATTATMYVSGPIEYALGGITTPPGDREAFWDRTTNLWRIEAQRPFIARVDPVCVYSITAYLPRPTQGETE